jgi:hypothetical protein
MKHRFTAFSLLAALLMAGGVAVAQDATDTLPAHPRFARLLPRLNPHLNQDFQKPSTTPLTTWNGSFVYNGTTYNYNMVGTAPSTGTSTTIPTYIIPLKIVFNNSAGNKTSFSAEHTLPNGQTVVANTVASPIFQTRDYTTREGTDLGITQYEDAFQRGNFWGEVSSARGYHVLLGQPTVKKLQTLNVPLSDGSLAREFGASVGLADIDWFDSQIQAIITELKLGPNTLPIFVTYNVYLTEGGECCIGGYHSAMGSAVPLQAYSYFTYVGKPGAFAQDVSALSHEAGEWLDDPLTLNTEGNPVPCGILEVGDPEEGFAKDGSAYGAFPYTLNGFTYHLQDLVYLEYFGAPTTTSVDGGTLSFHDNPFGLGVCSNGG